MSVDEEREGVKKEKRLVFVSLSLGLRLRLKASVEKNRE